MSQRIIIGDVLAALKKLPAESVDIVICSPPYWGLRDYGVEGQMGQERTLGEHIQNLVVVFREMRRVMKSQAAFWLNYGDCYATTPNGRSAADTKKAGKDDRTFRDKPFSTIGPIYSHNHKIFDTKHLPGGRRGGGHHASGGVLKPKDLCLVPFRLVIALQEDGWWIRSRCVWGKPNAMPDSAGKYRPSISFEEVFFLGKTSSPNYFPENVRKLAPDRPWKSPDGWDTGLGAHGSFHKNGREKGQLRPQKKDKQRGHRRPHQGFNDRLDKMTREEQMENGRLLRAYETEVWHIPASSFSDAHFATFPPALVERCLLASAPPGAVVLDPFGGAGTVCLVAERMGFDSIMIELNPQYAEIARKRLAADRGLFAKVQVESRPQLKRKKR